MMKAPPWFWELVFIIGFSIVFSIAIVLIYGTLVLRPELITSPVTSHVDYVVATVSVLVSCVAVYAGYRKGQISYVTLTFTVLGLVLILSATVAWIPYTTYHTVRRDTSQDWTPFFYSYNTSQLLVDENSTKAQITLQPNETRVYWQYYPRIWEQNGSVFQIELNTSGQAWGPVLIFEIESQYPDPSVIYLNKTEWNGSHDVFYWASPNEDVYSGLVFYNPSNQSVSLDFRIQLFYYEATDSVGQLNYATLANPFYVYLGICFIGIAVIVDRYLNASKKTL